MNTKEIARKFDIIGEVPDIKTLGNGLINDTYLITTSDGAPDYVLQRINSAIFQDVELLHRNIDAVTAHIRGKLEKAGEKDIDRKVLSFVKVKNGEKTYWSDGENYWRISLFIPDTVTKEEVNPESSYLVGKAFGKFEAMLADIPVKLGETITDFHNIELRSRQLKEAVAKDTAGRMSDPEVKAILAEMEKYDYEMCKAERMYRKGILPKRICHCDTKVNNMLFDKDGNVLCVIDLDTTMPGFVFSDFGDFLRSGANTVAEDDPNIDKIEFRMEIFKSFAKGYIESATFLTPIEKENLPYGTLLFQYMQAVRFFADYINGDTYYKIKYPEHNLVRTRNQMALFRSTLKRYDEMVEYIKYLNS